MDSITLSNFSASTSTINGTSGDDTLFVSGEVINTVVDAGDGNDVIATRLTDTSTGNTFLGGNGNDQIFVTGGQQNVLDGGAGDDFLQGSTGSDTLTGGTGSDTFHYGVFAGQAVTGNDTITDFESGVDVIEFDGLFADSNAVLAAATQTEGGVLITINSNSSILLENLTLADLHASDIRVNSGNALVNSADGSRLNSDLSQLVQAIASYPTSSGTFDSASHTQSSNDPGLQNIIAAASH